MKKSLLGAVLLALTTSVFAQDPALKPFYHGVASGDALSDRVIIWTRITPDSSETGMLLTLDWLIATDTLFTNIVNSGTAVTDSTVDFTVKVDVTGLTADTWYYYVFKYNRKNSLIGRTKTLPTGDNSHIRMAVVSCASLDPGDFYNSYQSLLNRNDLQAIIHLGDYIYEYPGGGLTGEGVPILPNTETTTLDKYRQRYSAYHLEPELMRLHQQYPFYTVWDDHETANNSWFGGAENHTPGTEGVWADRKEAGKKANFEWLPKRQVAAGNYTNYRTFSIGDLADLIMLDTRLEGRDQQVGTTNVAALLDTARSITGATQMQWLKDQLSNSTAQWKIIGQQVMIAPLRVFGAIVNADQWDGYQADRNRVIAHVLDNDIENVVVLTGDIHTSWANDVPGLNYNPSTGAGSAFVEFVTPGITSSGSPIAGLESLILSQNSHIKWADLSKHGYFILDIDEDRVQADWVFVSAINSAIYTENVAASWAVNDGERFLHQESNPATGFVNTAPFAPLDVDSTPVSVQPIGDAFNNITIYPNPFESSVSLRLNHPEGDEVVVRLYNVLGKLMTETTMPASGTINIDLPNLKPGTYLLSVSTGKKEYKTTIIKGR